MRLHKILEQVPVGGSFYRESNPDILYERIGTLIERDGLGWARLEGYDRHYVWTIVPEQRIEEEIQATDWTLQSEQTNDSGFDCRRTRNPFVGGIDIDLFEQRRINRQ
jgi:hypothetical protein